jgi:hemoglobin
MNASIRWALAIGVSLVAGCAGTPPKHAAAGITKVVDAALAEIHGDLRINIFFEKTDMADLRRLLIEQICAATGGPCTYSGRSMEEAHSGLNLTNADFDAFVEDLVHAMNSTKVPPDLQKQLLDLLGPMRPQVVGQ